MPNLQEIITDFNQHLSIQHKKGKRQMEEKLGIKYRNPLQWGEFDPDRRRNMFVGMWAWMWQRISALAIVFFLTLHITLTYQPWLQFLLLLSVTFHATLGLRVILLDFNIVNVKYQRALIWSLTGLGLVVMILIWRSIY
jgi:succinate dehydrogenase / fumarate reductase cytochrome b subunit